MGHLNENQSHILRSGIGSAIRLQAYKTADDFYERALLCKGDNNRVAPLGATGWPFVGLCCERLTTRPHSKQSVTVHIGGRIMNTPCVGVMSFNEVGRIVFCATDNLKDFTLTPVGSPVGIVRRFIVEGYCDVELFEPVEAEEQMWRIK